MLRPLIALCLVAVPAIAQGLPPVPVPPGNPITPERALLGKVLFWDEQLSSTGTVACGTCHMPEAGGSDPRSAGLGIATIHPGLDGQTGTADDVHGSRGVIAHGADGLYQKSALFALRPQVTARKAPTVINAAYAPVQFWDGRALGTFLDPVTGAPSLLFGASLESQASEPPVSDVEMAHFGRDWEDVAARIAGVVPLALAQEVPDDMADFVAGRTYPELFAEAFANGNITPARIARAIATYERTLISDQTPWDAFVAGDLGALTFEQAAGLAVFNGPGNCTACHNGPLFTNQAFRNIGVRPIEEDPGLGGVTGLAPDQGRFKVPTLRNVGLRAPYFHNGGMATLEEVVEFYDRGGDFFVNQAPAIQPLGLTDQQKSNLVAFLEGALTDPRVAAAQAPFDHPTLYAGSAAMPEPFGVGAAGSGGIEPRHIANEPPVLGNDGMTVGIRRGLGGAPLLLGLDTAALDEPLIVKHLPFHLAGTPAMHFVPLGVLQDEGAGQGFASFQWDIPDNPTLLGAEIILQWFVVDPGAEGGVAATRGLSVEPFAPFGS